MSLPAVCCTEPACLAAALMMRMAPWEHCVSQMTEWNTRIQSNSMLRRDCGRARVQRAQWLIRHVPRQPFLILQAVRLCRMRWIAGTILARTLSFRREMHTRESWYAVQACLRTKRVCWGPGISVAACDQACVTLGSVPCFC